MQRFDDIFRDNQFYADSCRAFCRESSCAKTSSTRCRDGFVWSFVLSSADFQDIVQKFSANKKHFRYQVWRNMFLRRNDCVDGIMDTVLHIAQEMVCCNDSFALRNYRLDNNTVWS